MKLIIGLGNPGLQYENTRHNIGFDVIDLISQKLKIKLNKEKFNGVFGKADDLIIAKPLTFMNLSGDFAQAIIHFYKIAIEDVIVIYDDMNFEPGILSIKPKGSSGGQNGMKDIIAKLGSQNIARIKVGIGRSKKNAIGHVLGRFSAKDKIEANKSIELASEAAMFFWENSIEKTMTKYNPVGKVK